MHLSPQWSVGRRLMRSRCLLTEEFLCDGLNRLMTNTVFAAHPLSRTVSFKSMCVKRANAMTPAVVIEMNSTGHWFEVRENKYIRWSTLVFLHSSQLNVYYVNTCVSRSGSPICRTLHLNCMNMFEDDSYALYIRVASVWLKFCAWQGTTCCGYSFFFFSFIHNSSTSMIPVVLSLHISQLNISLTLQIMKKDQKGPFLRWIMYRFHCRSRRTHKAHTVCHTSPFSAFLKDIFYTKIVPFILFFSICFWPILSYIISVLEYSNVIIKPVTNTREYANILNIGVPSTVLESF